MSLSRASCHLCHFNMLSTGPTFLTCCRHVDFTTWCQHVVNMLSTWSDCLHCPTHFTADINLMPSPPRSQKKSPRLALPSCPSNFLCGWQMTLASPLGCVRATSTLAFSSSRSIPRHLSVRHASHRSPVACPSYISHRPSSTRPSTSSWCRRLLPTSSAVP